MQDKLINYEAIDRGPGKINMYVYYGKYCNNYKQATFTFAPQQHSNNACMNTAHTENITVQYIPLF